MLLSFRKVRHISLILFNSRTEAKQTRDEKKPEAKKAEEAPEKKKDAQATKKGSEPETEAADRRAPVAVRANRGRAESPLAATVLSPAFRRIVEEKTLDPEKI